MNFEAHHDHARDPEEDDVERGQHQVGRVVVRQVARLVRPAHRGERPEPRAEPGVEHVGLLRRALRRTRTRPASLVARSSRRTARSTTPGCGGPTRAGARCTSRGCCTSTRSRSSPSSRGRSGSAPSSTTRIASSASGSTFTNHCVDTSGSTTVVQRWQVPTLCWCGSTFSSSPSRSRWATTRGARLEPVQARVRAGLGGHLPVFVDHRRPGAGCAACPISKSLGSCAGRHLDHAGAERGIDELVGDDGDLALHQRQPDRAARPGRGTARRPGSPPPPCRRASSRVAWWPHGRQRRRRGPGSGCATACRRCPRGSTSRSESAVWQRGHQFTMYVPR